MERFGAIDPKMLQRETFTEIIDTNSNTFLVSLSTNTATSIKKTKIKLDPNAVQSNNHDLEYYRRKKEYSEDVRNKNNYILNYQALMIKAIQLPDIGFTPITSKRLGYNIHNAGEIEIGNIALTSYNDIHGWVLEYWYDYFDKIVNGDITKTDLGGYNFRLYPDEYKINIKVLKLYRTSNVPSVEYTFTGCWPTNIGGINMDWDSFDTAPTFNIEMKVDKFSIKTFIPENEPIIVTQGYLSDKLDEVKKQKEALTLQERSELWRKNKEAEIAARNLVKGKYDDLNKNLKSKLKITGDKIIELAKRRIEDEIRERLPKQIRDLDFFNWKRLIDQIYSRLEGYTLSQISDYIRDFPWPPTNTTQAGYAKWYSELTDVTDFPQKNLLELIDWHPTNETRRTT